MLNRLVAVGIGLGLSWMPFNAKENPQQLFLRAREMQQSKGGNDSAAAAALFKKVAAALPNSPEAHLRLSEALLESHDIKGAFIAAKRAQELAPKSPEIASNLAIIEFAMAKYSGQNHDSAKASLLKATKMSPGDPELWFHLVDLCESKQDVPGALNAWLHLGNLRPHMQMGGQPLYIVAFERAAYLAYTLKRYNERREACLALAREANASEHHLRLLEELAREQVDQGYLGHAEESFGLLATRLPEEASVWQNIALVQRQSDRFADAVRSLHRAQGIKPEARNIVLQAYCLINLGQSAEALAILNELDSRSDYRDDSDQREYARGLLSACLLMLDRPDELIKNLKSWIGKHESEYSLSQRAHALLKSGNLKDARIALLDGMKLFPEQLIFKRAASIQKQVFDGSSKFEKQSALALRQISLEADAYLFAEFRQWGMSLEAIQKIHKLSPIQDAELLLLQSNALEALGQSQEAIKILRQCRQLAPSYSTVQNNLGYIMLERGGDIEEAASLIKSALEQEPNNASYMDSWGWALFKQGQIEEAEKVLRKAAEANPYSPEILKHLGEALLSLNRPQDAIEQWEKALAFAFPDRQNLEARLNKLKTDLAKKALQENESGPDQDTESSNGDGNADEDWMP
jgi:tetratricopeptide (TPR) repeat protein